MLPPNLKNNGTYNIYLSPDDVIVSRFFTDLPCYLEALAWHRCQDITRHPIGKTLSDPFEKKSF
jgi:hypothetical protein